MEAPPLIVKAPPDAKRNLTLDCCKISHLAAKNTFARLYRLLSQRWRRTHTHTLRVVHTFNSTSPVLRQVRDGLSASAPGGFENGKLPRAAGQPLDGLAGGVPGQSQRHTRGGDGDPAGAGGPGRHRAPGHGESVPRPACRDSCMLDAPNVI